jgi:hypothetical protein
MSQQNIQFLEIALIALFVAITVLRLHRKYLLSFRYTMGWLVLCALGLLSGLLIPLLGPIASALQVSEIAVVAAAAISILLVVSIQLSVSISGLQREVQKIAEDLALLREGLVEDKDHS